MVKATKLTLAAALLAGSCSFAIAQGGAGGEPPRGSDANPPSAVKQQPGATQSAPAQGTQAPAPSGSKQVQNPTAPAAQGAETGSARDPAGPGANRNAQGSGNPKGGHAHKMTVLGLVERNTGKCRMIYRRSA